MENQENTVPFIVFESVQAKDERTIHRLWILCIIIFLALIFSNLGWLIYESQFEEVSTITQEVEQEADNGSNTFIGGNVYGETENNNEDN